jgi:hypothetical protein
MLSTTLTEFHRAFITGTEWGPGVPIATLGQRILNFVKPVKLQGELIARLLVHFFAGFGNAAREFPFSVGSITALRCTGAHLAAHSMKPGFIHGPFVLLLGSISEANVKFGVDMTDRCADALKALEVKPLIDTIAVADGLTEDMFATRRQ